MNLFGEHVLLATVPLLRLGLILLPVAVGMVALWLLLPQGRRQDSLLTACTAGAAALLVGGLVVLQRTGAGVPIEFDLLFYVFAGVAIVSGYCMITQHNPVYSALWFAMVVLSTCGLFLLQSAPFLAAATIIVYAGAIIVTFLFVIMLAQQSGLAIYDRQAREPLLACVGGFVLLAALLYAVESGASRPTDAVALPAYRAELDRTIGVLHQAARDLQNGKPVDDVGKTLYLRAENADSAIGNVLYVQTETLPETERQQWRAQREQLITRLGQARMADDRKLMGETVNELTRFSEALRLRLQGSPLSRLGGAGDSHVGGLGGSLFGDYLWAVELAGSLLLVATVGAIAIAFRRKEGAA
jgi:NADH-quinone oxidoreductase subunit J